MAKRAAYKERVSQSDVPAHSLAEALQVAQAIVEYGSKPTTPLDIAAAMRISPSSSTFRMRCGAAVAYGLTLGGYNVPKIGLAPLGSSILEPKAEGQAEDAKRQAVLKPTVIRNYLTRYDGKKLPPQDIARNVLGEYGIAPENRERVRLMIEE